MAAKTQPKKRPSTVEPGKAVAAGHDKTLAWRKLKFGLMMHWGLYSVAGGVWKGENIGGYNEQIMDRAKISWPEYNTLLDGFTAAKWNPAQIAKLAQEAGMRYVVITTKHHDGFNIWHTKLSSFNPVDSTPAKKDPLKLLADACVKQKIAFGAYYSLIDWNYPGAAPKSDSNSDPITPALEEYTLGQLRELLTGYGPLCEIWFDMGKPTLKQSVSIANLVHSLQPSCRVNGRIWNGQDDFMECGDNETPDLYFDGAWESASTIFHDTWGYRSWQVRDNLPGKIRERIRELALVTARGGNYLLNIGPRGDGSIVEYDADVLRGIGKWMKANGEAIYDGEPEPHLKLDFGYATGKPGRLFLYVANPPADGILRVPGWQAKLPKAMVLGGGRKAALLCKLAQGELTINLPVEKLDASLTIVAVDYQGQQPYLPENVTTLDMNHPVPLMPESSLPRHHMVGGDYYSLRKFVSSREWLVQAPKGGKWRFVAIREKGGAVAGYCLDIDGSQSQFIMPEVAGTHCHGSAPVAIKPGRFISIKIQGISPNSELDFNGLELKMVPLSEK